MITGKDLIDIDGLLKRFDSALDAVSKEVGFEIEGKFESAISEFYSDYTPIYRRTGYMYYLSSGYNNYSVLSRRIGDLKYEAGIDVKPSNVPGNPYEKNPHHGLRVTPEFVYNISYMRGIHGFNRSDLTFKRNEKTGELLRKDSRSDKKAVYRKDGWKPGFKNDMAFTSLLEKADIPSSFSALEGLKNSYSRSYYPQHHVPTNSIPPAVLTQRGYKEVCKSIGIKINRAMGIIL